MGELDRISQANRPEGSAAGTQRWRELLFVHWPVPVEALRPLVPNSLELDLYDGHAWVGVVPFAMEGVKPWWSPEIAAFSFLETNVRTYVHHNGEPGVFFLSLEAASWVAVQAARAGWGLPYFHAEMSMKREGNEVSYKTARRDQPEAFHHIRYQIGELLGPSEPGTVEHFFLERYLLFSTHRGQLQRGQVYHTPYPAQRATVLEVSDGLLAAAGLPQPQGLPSLAHYAAGVDVEVFRLAPV